MMTLNLHDMSLLKPEQINMYPVSRPCKYYFLLSSKPFFNLNIVEGGASLNYC